MTSDFVQSSLQTTTIKAAPVIPMRMMVALNIQRKSCKKSLGSPWAAKGLKKALHSKGLISTASQSRRMHERSLRRYTSARRSLRFCQDNAWSVGLSWPVRLQRSCEFRRIDGEDLIETARNREGRRDGRNVRIVAVRRKARKERPRISSSSITSR
jgi:hypothetical protein